MPHQDDETYARKLIDMLERDCDRLSRDRGWASVAVGSAEEVVRQLGELRISADLTFAMRRRVAQALKQVRNARLEEMGRDDSGAGRSGASRWRNA